MMNLFDCTLCAHRGLRVTADEMAALQDGGATEAAFPPDSSKVYPSGKSNLVY
jgi:hypothetical protein